MEKIVLLGAGGHAKSVVDSIEELGIYEIIGFLDTKKKKDFEYRGYYVIGEDNDLKKLYEEQGVKSAFITIGSIIKPTPRLMLYKKLKQIGYKVPSIIDKTAIIAKDCKIGEGTFVGKKAVINSEAIIGKMCIINTSAIVEHECLVEDFVHLSVGSIICGGVVVEKCSFVGANATVIQGLKLEMGSVVGAGTCVRKNLYSI